MNICLFGKFALTTFCVCAMSTVVSAQEFQSHSTIICPTVTNTAPTIVYHPIISDTIVSSTQVVSPPVITPIHTTYVQPQRVVYYHSSQFAPRYQRTYQPQVRRPVVQRRSFRSNYRSFSPRFDAEDVISALSNAFD